MAEIYKFKDSVIPANITDVDTRKGVVTGYFSNFNSTDSDGDIIKPGAFARTIRERGPKSQQPRIKHLMNHDPAQPLGKLVELNEDSKGLAYESEIGKHTLGKDFLLMVDGGLITEHSIGYRVLRSKQLRPWEDWWKNPAAGGWREIIEMELREGSSLTAWGANPLTPITSSKGDGQAEVDRILKQQKRIEEFCRKSEATDDTLQMLLLHSQQLAQLATDLQLKMQKSTKPSPRRTAPGTDAKALVDALNKFTQKLNA
jgi:HK97 family phage prohead protease